MDCVVDACVGVKLYVIEELSDKAEALFAHLALSAPPVMCVPDLFRLECANVLWKHVRRGAYDGEHAVRAVAELSELELVWVPTALLVADALRLAIAHDIAVYDAVYAALASLEDLPLVTADKRLVQRLNGSGVRVLSLADYEGG